jgi:hypothetical protein
LNVDSIEIKLRSWLDASTDPLVIGIGKMTSGTATSRSYAWVSKERLNRAGEAIRNGNVSDDDALCLDTWRSR